MYAAGKSYEGVHTVSTRLLKVLGVEGKVVRGRPLGSWTSGQFRWAVAPPHPELDAAEAQAALLGRWLAVCGPATEADLQWWTGWKVTDVRRALAAIGARPVSLDEGVGYVVEGDVDPVGGARRAVGRAAARPRSDGDGLAAAGLVSGTGVAARRCSTAAATWGRRCGGTAGWWAGGPSGRTGRSSGGCWTPRAWGASAKAAIAAEAERLRGWVGTTRVTPRFRTPLEKELSA